MKAFLLTAAFAAIAGLSGCDRSSQGFSLPQGNAELGEQVFVKYQCLSCHTMAGYEAEAETLSGALQTPVALGGQVSRIRTYPELVTSVINPSHRLAEGYEAESGQSVMPSFNDVMTVTELVNLVYFLESHYELEPYPRTEYMSPR
ncbi:c-type cytochrome [Photobacterium halotolerans]|uniref:c-type cytochrome n=1 Tax=Photobacterium halotolerans TaxID=265726 RepID=UPI001372451B|nr:c-type cytochrome [Photobacterium halotolerans]NAW88890.1 c-type cytochrome [Photobacterium halotolerans]